MAIPIPEHTVEVEWTAAVSMLVRRETLEKIGLFDETFFLYYEETDPCRRARGVRRVIERRPDARRPHITRDFIAHNNFLPERLRKR